MIFLFYALGFLIIIPESKAFATNNKINNNTSEDSMETAILSDQNEDFNRKTQQTSVEGEGLIQKTRFGGDEIDSDGLAIPDPVTTAGPNLRDLLSMVKRKFADSLRDPLPGSKEEGSDTKTSKADLLSYRVEPSSIIKVGLQTLLSSDTLRWGLGKLSRKSAAVYRALKTE